MNESREYSILEIFLVLLVVFGLFIYLVFYKSTNTQNIVNSNAENGQVQNDVNTPGENTSIAANKDNLSIYEMYIAKKKEMAGSSDQEIISSVQTDLNQKISVPLQATPTIQIGNFDKKIYNQQFEKIFQEEKKLGLSSESSIFKLQYQDQNLFIPLSDYDRDTLLRSTNIYTEFANRIEALETPTIYKIKGEETVKAARNIVYILNKLRGETDATIYKLWLEKYLQQLSVIIAARYVQN